MHYRTLGTSGPGGPGFVYFVIISVKIITESYIMAFLFRIEVLHIVCTFVTVVRLIYMKDASQMNLSSIWLLAPCLIYSFIYPYLLLGGFILSIVGC